MPSIMDNLFRGKILNDITDRVRKEVRAQIFHSIADQTIKPRVDSILERFIKR
jgi:hypothetical protein